LYPNAEYCSSGLLVIDDWYRQASDQLPKLSFFMIDHMPMAARWGKKTAPLLITI